MCVGIAHIEVALEKETTGLGVPVMLTVGVDVITGLVVVVAARVVVVVDDRVELRGSPNASTQYENPSFQPPQVAVKEGFQRARSAGVITNSLAIWAQG